jgi:hypothetical protein
LGTLAERRCIVAATRGDRARTGVCRGGTYRPR